MQAHRTKNGRSPGAKGCARDVLSRRGFLAGVAGGLAGTLLAGRTLGAEETVAPVVAPTQVALTQGGSRADNIFQALKRIAPQIRAGLAAKKRIIIKPNFVVVDRQLCASHAECVEGILEFLAPLVQEEIVIAETPANGPLAEAISNYGFGKLQEKYRVRFVNLDEESSQIEYVVNERHYAVPIRFSRFLLDPEAYIVSTAPFKTHDRVAVTLGLKNLVVGGILKDVGFRWGAGSRGTSDKHLVHGGPENQGIHYNLFTLARKLHPDLSVLDGFEGMEHNGPVSGTPVEHRVAVAGTDWLATDRVAVELMGFDYRKIGYMVFAAQAGMGRTELEHIEILGPAISEVARSYQPHDNIEQQYKWI